MAVRPQSCRAEESREIYDTHCYSGWWDGSEGQFALYAESAARRGRATGKPIGNTEYVENFSGGRVTRWMGPKPADVSKEGQAAQSPLSDVHVLVGAGETRGRDLLVRLLQDRGATVVASGTAEETLAVIESSQNTGAFDIALIDEALEASRVKLSAVLTLRHLTLADRRVPPGEMALLLAQGQDRREGPPRTHPSSLETGATFG